MTLISRSTLLFVASGLATVALAAGDPGAADHGAPLVKVGLHALNLAILLGVLGFLLRGRIKTSLADRSLEVKREIDSVNELRNTTQARFDDLERRLSGFEGQLAEMRAEAEADAEGERKAIIERGKRDAVLIANSAKLSIRDETQRARLALRRDAVDLAVELAAEKLKGAVQADDQKRLTGQFLEALDGGQTTGADNG